MFPEETVFPRKVPLEKKNVVFSNLTKLFRTNSEVCCQKSWIFTFSNSEKSSGNWFFVKLSVFPQNFWMDTRKTVLTDVPKVLFQNSDYFFLRNFKEHFFDLMKKNFTSGISSGNERSVLNDTAWSFPLEAGVFWPMVWRKTGTDFLGEKIYVEKFLRTRRLKFWQHCTKFSSKSRWFFFWWNYKSISIFCDKKTIIIKISSEKLAIFSNSSPENFPKWNRNVLFGPIILMELNLFSKKIFLSEIAPGQAECNFLNSNETFCNELWI